MKPDSPHFARLRPAALVLLGALASNPAPALAGADEPLKELAPVNVNGIKDPEMRSYRSIWAGLDAFDAYRAMAPQASLRFQMTHADGRLANAADGLALRLATDDSSAPVPIDADGRVSVQRDRAAYKADATFILNKKSGAYLARPDVRTPGLPDNVRRLGDLRLECRVTVAVIKEQIPLLAKAAINTLLMTSDWCGKKDMNFSYPSGKQVLAATMRAGTRTLALEADEWRFKAPIGSSDWPDDALIELRFAAPEASAAAAGAP